MPSTLNCPSIDEFMAPFENYFHRSESRELAKIYVTGLLMAGKRKSVEPMSERVHASERGLQRLLSDEKWDEKGLVSKYRTIMLAATADPAGVLVLDDTGFSKKGRNSVCVARQYCGTISKTDNCQIGVSMTYVGADVAWPYAMELFVPETWDLIDDAACMALRTKTRMPETARHKSTWQMALDFVDLARSEKVPHRAVLADSRYGMIPEFRQGLNDRNENYIVGAHANTQVFLEDPIAEIRPGKERKRGRPRKYPDAITANPATVPLSALGESVADDAWQRLKLRRNFRDKPLSAEAVSIRVWPSYGWQKGKTREQVWVLIERRRLTLGGYELHYFFSNVPMHMPTIDIARLCNERYWIERSWNQLKGELGLDHHEGRSWIGWHRHVLLVFLAYGYLSLSHLQEKKRLTAENWTRWIRNRSILGREYFS